MGQSSSTARHLPDTHSDHQYSDSIARESRTNEEMDRHAAELAGEADVAGEAGVSPAGSSNPLNNEQANEAEESWHQPTGLSNGHSQQMRDIQEEAPELDQTEREYRSAAIARMAARRQSTMSRLGSRILPNSVIRGLLNSQEETPAEGHAHRHGLVSRPPPRTESSAHSTGRFSPFSALGSRGITRRRSTRGPPYFIPPRPDSTILSDGAIDDPPDGLAEPTRASWRRNVRLNRMRHSISSPISHMFGPSGYADAQETASEPSGTSLSDSLPTAMDTRLDYAEPLHELDSVEPGISSGESSPLGPNPNLIRRLPGLLRTRSPRALRQEDQTPLSRVLQLAAAAIAAQLSGVNGPALPNIHALGNDGLDGTLEGFLRSLQNTASAQAQPPAQGESSSNSGNEGTSPPVNLLRVFRFANSDPPMGTSPFGRSTNDSETPRSQSDRMSVDEQPTEGPEGRTVTLVVVGVRSVPSGNGGNNEQGSPGQGSGVGGGGGGGGGGGLDALLGLPFLPQNIPRPQEMPGDTEQTDGRPRIHLPRPTGLPTPGLLDPLRQARTNGPHGLSDIGNRPGVPSYPPGTSDSPPESHPPPSTPADQGLSTLSGTTTPSRRPSSTSALSPQAMPQLPEDPSMQPIAEPVDEPMPVPSSAETADSEYARHRALGSGNVRRNGVVEPDQPSPSGGRSWLIYVVGTNLSENHPALTTPSLFTDNPTYEDMILLSSLLGPAKPPVASQEDVNSAGGLFRLVEYGGSLVAESINGTGTIQMQEEERCLICLSDYEVAEEVRELAKCKHVFHRDCIDQWLTTGRNSCVLYVEVKV
ncbi:hypothetical protein N7468_005903 [Penicillium chermesinum]|uniref:RING-type E3 ubiquitin transferase n=1 Tax=Penicillium chermesinum TaxID=63820 RepID=A0A9W9P2I1_9EURO|nr:uncharacterized protein N7468_005903 [Penicillium chermesinum]KAJ5232947.1 hypothetical protein N7468_005903 [Penicillium chermesinum]